jgi:3-hydroxymyristoyl/3-hydroxydecanoyl-(acyl carrier protein) dehydratase
MKQEVRRCISPDHPCLAGHFPGHPVVPGVLLLSEILQAVEQQFNWTRDPVTMTSVKFLRFLFPGEPFTLVLEPLPERRLSFVVMRDDVRIAAGMLHQPRPLIEQDPS